MPDRERDEAVMMEFYREAICAGAGKAIAEWTDEELLIQAGSHLSIYVGQLEQMMFMQSMGVGVPGELRAKADGSYFATKVFNAEILKRDLWQKRVPIDAKAVNEYMRKVGASE